MRSGARFRRLAPGVALAHEPAHDPAGAQRSSRSSLLRADRAQARASASPPHSLGLLSEAVHSGHRPRRGAADLLRGRRRRSSCRPSHHVRPREGRAPRGARGGGDRSCSSRSVIALVGASRGSTGSLARRSTRPGTRSLVVFVVIAIDVSRASSRWRAARRYSSAALPSNALHFAQRPRRLGRRARRAPLVRRRLPARRLRSRRCSSPCSCSSAAARLIRRNVDVLMDRAPAEATASRAAGDREQRRPGSAAAAAAATGGRAALRRRRDRRAAGRGGRPGACRGRRRRGRRPPRAARARRRRPRRAAAGEAGAPRAGPGRGAPVSRRARDPQRERGRRRRARRRSRSTSSSPGRWRWTTPTRRRAGRARDPRGGAGGRRRAAPTSSR